MNYGRYQIIKEVGRGSMGVVFEAQDPNIDRVVAVKVLRQDRIGTEAFVHRFLKEAKVIGRLSHPSIVAIYDVGEEQGTVYIAMEFLTGTSLADIVKESHLSADEIFSFGIQIAEALDYAHQKGVVHRDIKPSNIVVRPDGIIKISDFGIAHIDDSSATMQTQAGDILGTPSYMSPEQVLGKPVDGRSDLFSLGVILYELCTGRKAFGGRDKNLATIFNEIINVTPEEPFVAEALIPKKLSGIIMKALQKEPENRYKTGKEFAEALKLSQREPAPLEAPPAVEKSKKAGKMPLIAGISAVVVVIIAVGIFQGKQPTPHSAPAVKPVEQQIAPPPAPEKTIPAPPVHAPPALPHTAPAPPAPVEQLRPKQPPETTTVKRQPIAEKLPVVTLVSLKIKTTPAGAHVFVDGSSKGVSPITLQLAKGSHVLRMTHSGYRALEKQITLEETMEYPLTFELTATGK